MAIVGTRISATGAGHFGSARKWFLCLEQAARAFSAGGKGKPEI
jgi:hypothetical protein